MRVYPDLWFPPQRVCLRAQQPKIAILAVMNALRITGIVLVAGSMAIATAVAVKSVSAGAKSASAVFKIATICCSVNRDRFIRASFTRYRARKLHFQTVCISGKLANVSIGSRTLTVEPRLARAIRTDS